MENELIKLESSRVRCDNGACCNTATYKIRRQDTARGRELHLCTECIKSLKKALKEIKSIK